MQSPPDLNVMELLTKILGGAVAIIIALIGVIYALLRSTDNAQQDQLDDGAEEFTRLKIAVAEMCKDIQALEDDLKQTDIKVMQNHESMLLLKDHHRRNHGEEIK